MPNLTPNYGFNLPLVNDPIDADLWGNELNSNWSTIDTDLKSVSDVANEAAPNIGDGKVTFCPVAPAKWLFCDGSAVSRSTYSALFAAIGTAYGTGDGSTTFNLPDLGGRVPAGKEATATRLTAAVSGVDGATLGASGGDQHTQQHMHTASVTDPGHIHSISLSPDAVGNTGGSSRGIGSGGSPTNTASATTGITVSNADYGTGASQNVQPTLVVNWIIYAGV